jgi:hypothetical protein
MLAPGTSNLNVALQDAASAEVRLVFEFDDVPVESHLLIVDIATLMRHQLMDLHPWRLEVTIPLPIAKTTLNIRTSHEQILYRIVSLEVTAPMRDERLVERKIWKPYFENEFATISLGSGCWLPGSGVTELIGKDELLFLRRHAYLRIESKAPGDCWVAFPFKKILPSSPDPELTNDGLPIEADPTGHRWRITDYGGKEVSLLAFGTYLKPAAELGIHFKGTIRSQRELGSPRTAARWRSASCPRT